MSSGEKALITVRCIGTARVLSFGVCLSVTLVYCVEITELIIKQLALDCSLWTLVYDTKRETYIFGSLGIRDVK